MSRRKLLRAGVVSASGAAALFGVLGSQVAFGQQAGAGQLPFAGTPVTLYVMPGSLKGSDGQMHDAIVPSSLVFQSGVATTLNIVNFDDGSHTITSPDLGMDLTIQPGGATQPVTTTATLTFPQAGVYRWYCNLTCDGPSHYAMGAGWDGPGEDGYMAGNFMVV